MMAHTMGVPFHLDAVMDLVKKYNLWLIEDNCDALGSTYTLQNAKIQDLTPSNLSALSTQHPALA